MDSMIREALERIANECDIGEHTEIARKALLTADPEPCESSNYSDIPNSSRLPEHYGAGDLVDDLREDERSSSGRMEAPREYVLSYPESCSLVNRYASQVADKRAEELQAQVETLREALTAICECGGGRCSNTFHATNIKVAKEALAATEPKP